MKKALVVMFVVIIMAVSMTATTQTIDNGITLYVTKVTNTRYHLQWEDSAQQSRWSIYFVFASQNPRSLGSLVAIVMSDHVDLQDTQPNALWFFQIVRAGGNTGATVSELPEYW